MIKFRLKLSKFRSFVFQNRKLTVLLSLISCFSPDCLFTRLISEQKNRNMEMAKQNTVRNRNKNEIEHQNSVDVKDKLNLPKISFDEQHSNGQTSNYFHSSHHSSNCTKNDSTTKNSTGQFESRTIKAVTRYIDAQGKKAANLTKQQSQSMVNLSSNLSVEGKF